MLTVPVSWLADDADEAPALDVAPALDEEKPPPLLQAASSAVPAAARPTAAARL
jgi:hypothetical protein